MLLFHDAPANTVFYDSSPQERVITRVSTPVQDTDSPFAGGLGCGLFGGGTQSISMAVTSNLRFTSTSTFCVELWMKSTQTGGKAFFATYSTTPPHPGYALGMGVSSAGSRTGEFYDGTAWRTGGSRIVNDGNWHHLAMQSISGFAKLYVDGVLAVSWTMPSTVNESSRSTFSVGVDGLGTTYIGKVAGFRISNNTRYTAAFTPPTNHFEADANTLLLLNFQNY